MNTSEFLQPSIPSTGCWVVLSDFWPQSVVSDPVLSTYVSRQELTENCQMSNIGSWDEQPKPFRNLQQEQEGSACVTFGPISQINTVNKNKMRSFS